MKRIAHARIGLGFKVDGWVSVVAYDTFEVTEVLVPQTRTDKNGLAASATHHQHVGSIQVVKVMD